MSSLKPGFNDDEPQQWRDVKPMARKASLKNMGAAPTRIPSD
jgi:hypothetical protein